MEGWHRIGLYRGRVIIANATETRFMRFGSAEQFRTLGEIKTQIDMDVRGTEDS